ncbi:MAG: hypothetical protein ACPG7F_13695 [Aggregatilineales bacterium]
MSDNFLRWQKGAGWLVFSGGHSAGSPLRAQALARAKAAGGVAYISLLPDGGDALLDDMEDLGAPAGYIVDIVYEDAESIMEQLEFVAVLVIEIGESIDALYQAFQNSVAAKAIQQAYENGAVVLIEGLAGNLFGKWVISDSGRVIAGLNWVENAFIEPGVSQADESRAVQAILASEPDAISIEINTGSALVLGAGQLEIWGEKEVTISLGSAYSNPNNGTV